MKNPDLSVSLGKLNLKNPVITASGTCGYGKELEEYMNIEKLGALTVKGLSINPKKGNPLPRIAETPAGMLNSIGLENPGLKIFKDQKIPLINEYNLPVIVNISAHSIDDFAYLAEELSAFTQISALEVNVSCPNLDKGGMAFGTDSELIYQVTRKVNNNYPGTVIVKLSPNVTDIVEMASAAEEGNADVISLINTLLGMSINIDQQEPVLGNTYGGLSGPAIKPVALRMVYQVASQVKVPLIGMGGIMNGKDAIEFLLAGASAIGVGTATLVNPDACYRIISEIEEYLVQKDITKIESIIGKALIK